MCQDAAGGVCTAWRWPSPRARMAMAMPPVAMAPGHLPELAWWPQDWGPSLCAPTLERPLWAGHSWCRGPAGQAWVILLGRAWGRSVWTGACGPVRRLGGAWTSQPLVTDRGQGGGLGSGAPGARRKGPGSTPLPRSPPAPPDLAWGCRAGWVQGWPSLCACWSGGGQVHLTPLEARGGCFSCPGSRPGQSM